MSTTAGKSKTSSTDKKDKRQGRKMAGSQICGSLNKTPDSVLKRSGLLVDRAVVGDN